MFKTFITRAEACEKAMGKVQEFGLRKGVPVFDERTKVAFPQVSLVPSILPSNLEGKPPLGIRDPDRRTIRSLPVFVSNVPRN